MKSLLPLGVFALLLAGCASSGASPSGPSLGLASLPGAGGEPAPTAPPAAPVDTTIPPVSRANPGADAQQALDACGVAQYGLDHVASMGLVTHARDADQYARLSPQAPLLDSDAPAWVVQLRGEIPQPMSGEIWIDPTCVVVSGQSSFYATGPVRDGATGAIKRGYWGPTPQQSLPTLAP